MKKQIDTVRKMFTVCKAGIEMDVLAGDYPRAKADLLTNGGEAVIERLEEYESLLRDVVFRYNQDPSELEVIVDRIQELLND